MLAFLIKTHFIRSSVGITDPMEAITKMALNDLNTLNMWSHETKRENERKI